MKTTFYSEEGHCFSEEDSLFNMKFWIWFLYSEGYSDEEILMYAEDQNLDKHIDIQIELEKNKRYLQRKT